MGSGEHFWYGWGCSRCQSNIRTDGSQDEGLDALVGVSGRSRCTVLETWIPTASKSTDQSCHHEQWLHLQEIRPNRPRTARRRERSNGLEYSRDQRINVLGIAVIFVHELAVFIPTSGGGTNLIVVQCAAASDVASFFAFGEDICWHRRSLNPLKTCFVAEQALLDHTKLKSKTFVLSRFARSGSSGE